MRETVLLKGVNDLVLPEVAMMGYELIELDFTGGVLRLTIDKPGGITLDDCVAVHRRVSVLLDAKDPIEGSYRLEISSPGLNRRLKSLKDFNHFSGRRVKVHTKDGILHGTIKGLAGDSVLLDIDGSEILLQMQDIIKANLEFDF